MQSAAEVSKPLKCDRSLAVEADTLFAVNGVTWDQYVSISDAFPERTNVRVTFDGGALEIMSTSILHELIKSLLTTIVMTLMEALDVAGNCAGSMTHRRKDIEKALEPDACFYFANWHRVRGVERIDLLRHPPPDMAIEIDITNSSVPRMPIYEALGVRELWRFVDETIKVYVLSKQGKYREAKRSGAFPTVSINELPRFVRIGLNEDVTAMIRAVRAWARHSSHER